MVPDRTARQLDAIAHDVILPRQNLKWVLRLQRFQSPLRHREWIVRKFNFLGFVVPFIHGKIDDPAKVKTVLCCQFQFVADACSCTAGEIDEVLRNAGNEEHRIAIAKAKLASHGGGSFLSDIFRDRPCPFAIAEENIAQAWLTLSLGPAVHPVAKSAGTATLGWDGPYFRVFKPVSPTGVLIQQSCKNLETRAAEMLGDISHLNRVAQIGLICAVESHCLLVGNTREFLRDRLTVSKLLEQPAQHGFDRAKHVILGHVTHFYVKLVEFTGRPVGARVLVAETRGDLKIAVETSNHYELLELLRCLRQRVEFAWMHPRRHKKVACAFRG